MKPDLDKKIAVLKELGREELKIEWARFYGHAPPKKIGRGLLIRSIAYKYQEEAFGGLSPETKKELEKLIKAYRANPDHSFKKTIKFKPGTRLVRSWKGKPHEVTATENGFFYRGKEYGSLTQVAGVITGTHWAGTAFFGIGRKGRRAETEMTA